MARQVHTLNARISRVRRETLNGRAYLVANFVSLRPRVLNGSKGKLFYPASEISKNPGVWNHVPITLGHPTNPITNLPESARQPSVLNRVKLGEVYEDAVENGERKGEAWFDEQLTRQRSKPIWQVLNDAVSGKTAPVLELSTGLFTDDIAHNGVTDEGQDFEYVATNYRPDHLAVFEPGTARGACSVDDGCGIGVNAELEPVQKKYPHLAHMLNGVKEVSHVVGTKDEAKEHVRAQRSKGIFASMFKDPKGGKGAKYLVVNWEDGVYPTTNADAVGSFAANLLHAATNAHILHLRSRSFAEHKALGELYEALPGLVDNIVESVQGLNGRLADFPADYTPPPADALTFVHNLSEYVKDNRASLGNASQVQNAVDEVATVLDSTAYKLRFLDGTGRPTENQETTVNEESPQTLVGRFLNWLTRNAGANQTKNLEDGQFLPTRGSSGKQVGAAAKKGFGHQLSTPLPPTDDSDDDDGDSEELVPVVENEDGGVQSTGSEVYRGSGKEKKGALERAAAVAGSAEARSRAQQIMNSDDEDADDLSDNGDIIGGFGRLYRETFGSKQTVTEKATPPKSTTSVPSSSAPSTPSAPSAPSAPAGNELEGEPGSIEADAKEAAEAEPPTPPVQGTGMSGSPMHVGPTKNQGMVMNCPECGGKMTKNAVGVMKCNCGYTTNMESVVTNGSDFSTEVLMAVSKQRQEAVSYLTANCDCWKGKANVLANERAFTDADLEKLVKNAKKAKQDELVANSARRGVRVKGGTLTFNAEGRAAFNEKAEGSNADFVQGDKSADGRQAEVDPEEEVAPELEGSVDVGGKLAPGGKKGTTMNQWLNRPDVPAELKALARNYAAWEASEKQRLIGLLTQNVRDGELKKRLTANHARKSLQQLQDEAAALPAYMQPAVNQHRIGVQVPREPVYGAAPAVNQDATENQGEADVLPLPTMNWNNEAQTA